jgi:hypothetical protein
MGRRAGLTTARSTADYFVGHLPVDGVPYYDFQAPATDRPRDSSAAAIASSGLLWLARIEPDGVPRADLPGCGQADVDLALGAALPLAGPGGRREHAAARHRPASAG